MAKNNTPMNSKDIEKMVETLKDASTSNEDKVENISQLSSLQLNDEQQEITLETAYALLKHKTVSSENKIQIIKALSSMQINDSQKENVTEAITLLLAGDNRADYLSASSDIFKLVSLVNGDTAHVGDTINNIQINIINNPQEKKSRIPSPFKKREENKGQTSTKGTTLEGLLEEYSNTQFSVLNFLKEHVVGFNTMPHEEQLKFLQKREVKKLIKNHSNEIKLLMIANFIKVSEVPGKPSPNSNLAKFRQPLEELLNNSSLSEQQKNNLKNPSITLGSLAQRFSKNIGLRYKLADTKSRAQMKEHNSLIRRRVVAIAASVLIPLMLAHGAHEIGSDIVSKIEENKIYEQQQEDEINQEKALKDINFAIDSAGLTDEQKDALKSNMMVDGTLHEAVQLYIMFIETGDEQYRQQASSALQEAIDNVKNLDDGVENSTDGTTSDENKNDKTDTEAGTDAGTEAETQLVQQSIEKFQNAVSNKIGGNTSIKASSVKVGHDEVVITTSEGKILTVQSNQTSELEGLSGQDYYDKLTEILASPEYSYTVVQEKDFQAVEGITQKMILESLKGSLDEASYTDLVSVQAEDTNVYINTIGKKTTIKTTIAEKDIELEYTLTSKSALSSEQIAQVIKNHLSGKATKNVYVTEDVNIYDADLGTTLE